jgi:hypothetical protein
MVDGRTGDGGADRSREVGRMSLFRKLSGWVVLGALCVGVASTACPEDGAPSIPHGLDGRADCLSCHGTGTGAPRVPSDHAGRTNDQCQGCHSP